MCYRLLAAAGLVLAGCAFGVGEGERGDPPAASGMGAVAVGSSIVVIGGDRQGGDHASVDEAWVYDTDGGSWREGAASPTGGRAFPSVAAVGGKVFVVGGLRRDADPLASCEVYDPVADGWSRGPDMPTARNRAGACAHGGKVYVAGGYVRDEGNSRALERLDPVAGVWERLAPMPTARHGFALAAAGGKVYAMGGYGDGGELDVVEVYDPATDAWEAGPPLTRPRGFAAAAVIDSAVYITGSRLDERLTVDRLALGAEAWGRVDVDAPPRNRHGAAAVGGRLYLLGGENSDWDIGGYVLVIDPETGRVIER